MSVFSINQMCYAYRSKLMKPRRYRNLFKIICNRECSSILEIGVWTGARACQMIETAALFQDVSEIEYFGFDLFELMTLEVLEKELSKQPPLMHVVKEKVEKTGAKVNLYKGYTTDTLPDFVEAVQGKRSFDFIFIDGGHSIESIQFDWDCIKQLMEPETIVIFDDYYRNTEPETEDFGCQRIIDGLDPSMYNAQVLEPEDCFQKDWGSLNVSMACVRLRK